MEKLYNVEDSKPISYIKDNVVKVIEQVNTSHRPVFLTEDDETKAVLLDVESYKKMKDALHLLIQTQKEDGTDVTKLSDEDFFSALESEVY